ncbi:MAG: prenyltransferase/squalene oxidase repeat-containing protein [Planctomycetota bacterium]|jgi:hypothetical protein
MRLIHGVLIVSLVVMLGAAGVRADEEDDGASTRRQAYDAAFRLLRVRLEARLETARLLRELGRYEEALAMLRSVDGVYEEELTRLQRLLEPRPVPEVIVEVQPPSQEGGPSPVPFQGPTANAPIPGGSGAGGAFRGRGGSRQPRLGGGPTAQSENAVGDALKWLAAHQSPNGGWEAARFGAWCDQRPASVQPDGEGKSVYDVGVTGLALCAFLGAGYTNRGRHPFAVTVARGLRYLKNVQDAEGCFGPRESQHYIYCHATAALAMVEAYGMTQSPIFKGSAQKALDFIALSRNPYFAWRYGIKPGDNDTSVTGWMMMALKSAQLINQEAVSRGQPAPLTIDESAFDGIKAWLDKVTDPDYGRVGYISRGTGPARPQELIDLFPGEKSEAMTSVGILARIFLGEDPRRSELIQKGADLCLRLPPTWNPADGSIDMYYWYYGTLGMFQVGGSRWQRWNTALRRAVLETQRQDTDYCQYKGSWDPIGPWGPDGGRVYSTALMAMCMEVYYRYDRAFGSR